jgi:hypothetical protein
LPVLNPRTRLVNFRVSEDEFLYLKESCARSGARSISDYARSAVLNEATAQPAAVSGVPLLELSHRWNRLEQRIETVLSSVSLADPSSGQPVVEAPHE